MESISSKKISFFQEELLKWYEVNNRKYEWRQGGLRHYEYVIAEVLLQRTKADTVSKFYRQFIKDFPDWESLVDADISKVESYLIPVGLYKQRSKRLKNLAAEMVTRRGILPRDRRELEQIPFIGQYIANAIQLVIFHQPSPLIDVNMARVLERVFGPRQKADIRYDQYLQKLAYEVVQHLQFKELNWAILDFAALVCKARNPLCITCPLKKLCCYYKML